MSQLPTTGAHVECKFESYSDAAGLEDMDSMSMTIGISYNGHAGEQGVLTDRATFSRNANASEKQAAVRLRVNQVLDGREPGRTLNNANIQISGLPI